MACCDNCTCDELVEELVDEIYDYALEAVQNNDLTFEQYNQVVELVIAKLENAPEYKELF